jgi:glutathione synthase/RimK-type ligase-like ATP-grasp enzyme
MVVIASRKTKKSAGVLESKLEELDYCGQEINWGYSGSSKTDTINKPEALRNAVNKRIALEILDEEDVPTLLIDLDDYTPWPILGRPDEHSMGRWFYICYDRHDVRRATSRRRHAATHWQRYLTDFREFRVHIVDGESIKISEKVGGGNYHRGATFQYPEDFSHKKALRSLAKDAVEALELDFGAVDIICKDDEMFVLECNTAPRLTDEYSDTLERYAQAFKRSYDG